MKKDSTTDQLHRVTEFISQHPGLMVITGAGCSAASGIPTYRNEIGQWLRSAPVQHQEFVSQRSTRQRYWAGSMVGWPTVSAAEPNAAHRSLASLERKGFCSLLVTQNVDRLHQRAGHQNVIDLHGRIDKVRCLNCDHTYSRAAIQDQLVTLNPKIEFENSQIAPDGDADISYKSFNTPQCESCDGMLKPEVVFYGGTVDKKLVETIYGSLKSKSALMIVGSSLMVFSAYRFCRRAYELDIPIIAINRGQTRADELLSLKLDQDCQYFLDEIDKAL